MVSAAEQRILNWLGCYADTLEQAWDVPRELSLPGIAEGTGVVRSALHKPLKRLVEQGLVIIRPAHVLGGGGRKRSVHHITPKGRELVSIPKQSDSAKTGKIVGSAPLSTRTIGRGKEIQAISTADSQIVWISGMPGIGKSTLLRQIAEATTEDGGIVRWCSANSMMGAAAVVETWLELKSLPHNLQTLSRWVSSIAGSDLLIIDDFHLMASRHRAEIRKLLKSVSNGGHRVIVSFRPPLEVPEQNTLTLEGLPYEHAIELLEGFDDEKARLIVEHLDGHPLALAMVSEDLSLETAREGLEAFLEKEILTPLTENGRNAVDELAIQPEPVEAGSLAYQNELGTLDEHALLHNLEPPLVGLQQLIRNLRLEQLSLEQRKLEHMKAAKRMSSQDFPRADIRGFYHRFMGGDEELDDWMKIHGNQLVRRHPASFAALFENIQSSEYSLNWLMALAECELGEPKRSTEFLTTALENGEIEENPEVTTLRSRIHMLSGRPEAAEECRIAAIATSQGIARVKLIVAEASRKLDDRLPKQQISHDYIELIESIELSGLDAIEKQEALMAIATIKHTHHLLLGDFKAAAVIRADISEATPSSSLINELEWRASMAEGREYSLEIDEPLGRLGQIAWSLEYSDGEDKLDLLESMQSLLQQYNQVLERPAGRRAEALGWTWRGILDESVRTPAWSQAIHIWRSAECPRASYALEERLHSWLMDTGRT